MTNTEKDQLAAEIGTELPDCEGVPMVTVLDWCLRQMGAKEGKHDKV